MSLAFLLPLILLRLLWPGRPLVSYPAGGPVHSADCFLRGRH